MKTAILALLKGLRWLVVMLLWLYTVTIAGAWAWRQTETVNRAYALVGCEVGRRATLNAVNKIDYGKVIGKSNKGKLLEDICDPGYILPIVDAYLKNGVSQ